MGFTHAELGSLACAKWQLPRDLVVFIRHHHTPPNQRENVPAQIVPFFPLGPEFLRLIVGLKLKTIADRPVSLSIGVRFGSDSSLSPALTGGR